ncbi:DUF1127 domain-containing protein [Yoonia sp.]|uniref:DUF1127 domain-containing protein n=1 Tax=Yoonia sp. TaxID=2212373 RepID=UPI003F6B22AA
MAFFNEPLATITHSGLMSRIAARMVHWLDQLMEARSRSDVVARLENCSDADLKRMGVARSDIVRHVYRDVYYL